MNVISRRSQMPGRRGTDPLTRLGRCAIPIVLGSLSLGGLFSVLDVTQAAPVAQVRLPEEVLAVHGLAKRPVAAATTNVESYTEVAINSAQGPGPGAIGPGPGCDLFPAPPSVGTTVNLSYFGPPPSSSNQSLVGPVQLLNTGPVDANKGTITIPLYLGHMKNGTNVWFVLTDV